MRELHRNTGRVIAAVAGGEAIIVEKRGIPVAEMRPADAKSTPFPPSHWKSLQRYPQLQDDSTALISEDRDRR